MLLSCIGSRNGGRKPSIPPDDEFGELETAENERDRSASVCVGKGAGELGKSSKRNAKDVNGTINRRMRQYKKEYEQTYRLLLLGSGESGKSTIVKQMQILHKQGFSNYERKRKLVDIHRNCLDAMSSILRAMHDQLTDVQLSPNNQTLAQYVLKASQDINFEYTPEFFANIKQLWADEGVQTAFKRSNEYQLIDCAKYFLDKVDQLANPDYLPDDQDILRCRTQTQGIHQVKFVVDKVNFHMFDVGGQRYERRRWCQCFHGITAILFVSAMSDYNLNLAEDCKQNRLRESLKLFDEVWKNRFLQGVSVILFLNKQDVLEEKIMSGNAPLEEYFPEYAHYKARPSAKDRFDDDAAETIRAKLFIREMFLVSKFQPIGGGGGMPNDSASANSSGVIACGGGLNGTNFERRKSRQSLIPNDPNCNPKKRASQITILGAGGHHGASQGQLRFSLTTAAANQIRQCYAHFTCAVDTQNIQRIFNDVKNTIQIINLKNYELI